MLEIKTFLGQNYEADFPSRNLLSSACQAKIHEVRLSVTKMVHKYTLFVCLKGAEDEVCITGYKLVRWRWILVCGTNMFKEI